MTKECIFCGKETNSKKYICSECEEKMKTLKQITKLDEATAKMGKAHKRYLRKSYDYAEERDRIEEKIIKCGYKFGSKDEMCFALQLEKENIKYCSNYSVGNYKVDFFLPEIKRIVEVDGELYHTDENKEYFRERAIMRAVGEEFEIIRIPASEIQGVCVGDITEMLKYIAERRLNAHHFRDTRYDEMYLLGYLRERRKWERKR